MSKFSPGPWLQHALDPLRIVVRGDHLCVVNGRFPDGESEASARLIAAAPEMLELLRYVPECEGCGAGRDCPSYRARALIARIEGET